MFYNVNSDTYFDLWKRPLDYGRLKEDVLIDEPKEHKNKKIIKKIIPLK